jgi:GAF domain-containing protein
VLTHRVIMCCARYMRREVSAGLHVRIKLREGGFKSSVVEGKKTLMKDIDYNDPRMNKAHNLVTGLRTRNVLVSPIISPETGKVIGLIEMANKIDNRSFTKADVKLVELMAKHAAIFIEK